MSTDEKFSWFTERVVGDKLEVLGFHSEAAARAQRDAWRAEGSESVNYWPRPAMTAQPSPDPPMSTDRKPQRLADALNARVPFEDQDPDEQFYPARCEDDKHHWHENADAEGDTCNCGAWYRFADRIERTPR